MTVVMELMVTRCGDSGLVDEIDIVDNKLEGHQRNIATQSIRHGHSDLASLHVCAPRR